MDQRTIGQILANPDWLRQTYAEKRPIQQTAPSVAVKWILALGALLCKSTTESWRYLSAASARLSGTKITRSLYLPPKACSNVTHPPRLKRGWLKARFAPAARYQLLARNAP